MHEASSDMSARRTPRWVKLLLVVSLSINLAIAGLALGHRLKPHGFPEDRRTAWVYKILPEERHDEARAIFHEKREEMAERINEMQDVHRRIAAAIAADPLDQAELAAAFAARRDGVMKMHIITQGQLAALLTRMSPKERRQVAERLLERSEKWAERRARLYQ